MENVMTQGFTELNENEIVDIEGGKDWKGIVKGVGTIASGAGSFYYHVFTSKSCTKDVKKVMKGIGQVYGAWNS